jgi:hypothetical protein
VEHADHAIAYALKLGLTVNFDARGRRADSDALNRGVARGRYRRLTPGVFADAESWAAADETLRFSMRFAAIAATMSPDVVFSHATAALGLGLPLLGAAPARVDVTDTSGSGGRSTGNIRRHVAPLLDDETVSVAGFRVTSPGRTIADLARTLPFSAAVATADAALHLKRPGGPLLSPAGLRDLSTRYEDRKGAAKLRTALGFATPLSDSVRESESRCLIHLAGFPAPELQHEWRDDRGLIGYSDFWWPQHDLIGEYDGLVKYLTEEFRRGRTEAQVVVAEKRREDRLRALGPRVTRWATNDLTIPRLTRHLVAAGLPLVRAPRRA